MIVIFCVHRLSNKIYCCIRLLILRYILHRKYVIKSHLIYIILRTGIYLFDTITYWVPTNIDIV